MFQITSELHSSQPSLSVHKRTNWIPLITRTRKQLEKDEINTMLNRRQNINDSFIFGYTVALIS